MLTNNECKKKDKQKQKQTIKVTNQIFNIHTMFLTKRKRATEHCKIKKGWRRHVAVSSVISL